MDKKKKVINHVQMLNEVIESLGITPFKREYDCDVNWAKDFSILQDFTDEELAQELCRRTGLGKELE